MRIVSPIDLVSLDLSKYIQFALILFVRRTEYPWNFHRYAFSYYHFCVQSINIHKPHGISWLGEESEGVKEPITRYKNGFHWHWIGAGRLIDWVTFMAVQVLYLFKLMRLERFLPKVFVLWIRQLIKRQWMSAIFVFCFCWIWIIAIVMHMHTAHKGRTNNNADNNSVFFCFFFFQ